LVISLDFELHWGVRDQIPPDGSYRQNLLGEWEAVPRMLALFKEFDIAATWATVGFLFAKSKQELEEFSPSIRPIYKDPALYPYDEPIGESEMNDPLHFAPSLIEAIRRTPRQELACHTFSHYYCLEPGQNRETFEADLNSALAIAKKNGVRFRSIVFPRDQHNPDYDDLLVDAGITCYRGSQPRHAYRATKAAKETRLRRKLKSTAGLLDYYVRVSGAHTVSWEAIQEGCGRLCNIPGSFFMNPYSPRGKRFERLRLQRIIQNIKQAAVSGEVFHIWWHPHNFGLHPDQNIAFLRRLVEAFCRYRDHYGMRSMSMAEAAAVVRDAHTQLCDFSEVF
jgi:peptidoglycan/xylan/chitin deacetylase (PgdA/CDA1 family)